MTSHLVFSRCADSLEQGRRLENLSWRLWQREQLVDNEKRLDTPAIINTSPLATPSRHQDLPQLSGSVDSLVDEDATEFVSESAPLEIRPRIHRLDSTSHSSRRDRHISSDDFEKMVVYIVKDTAPLSAANQETTPTQKKAPAKFALGGSPSSNEQGMSVEMSKCSLMPPPKKGRFQMGGSSGSASTKSDIQPAKPIISEKMKQGIASTSRTSQLAAESAIDSDTDDDYVDESAIVDDSDWEDCADEDGKSCVEKKFFQRVNSVPNITSRPSLITLMVIQNERQKNLRNQASHSASAIECSRAGPSGTALDTSPDVSDEGPLIVKGMRPSNLKPIIEVPRSSAQPIETRQVDIHAAFSPRTTRRNMLATELSESLRRHLLWERHQKTSTANAVLRRRHTSHDVANLKQFPEKPCLKESEGAYASERNSYFNKDFSDGYHSKGW